MTDFYFSQQLTINQVHVVVLENLSERALDVVSCVTLCVCGLETAKVSILNG